MENSTRETVADLIRYTPSKLAPAVLGVISISLYTRLLKPGDYGRYVLVLTAITFIETLAFSWINQSTLRYLPKFSDEQSPGFFYTSFYTFLMVSLLVGIVWILIVEISGEVFSRPIRAMLLFGPIVIFSDAGSNLMFTYLRSLRQSLRYSVQRCFHASVKLAASIAFILFFNCGAEALFYGIFVAGFSILAIESPRFVGFSRKSFRMFSQKAVFSMAKYGTPLIGLSLANIVLSASDRYFIAFFETSSDVGIYSAGYRFTEMATSLITSFIMLAFFPILIETFEKHGENEAKQLMREVMAIFLILIMPVVSALSFLSKDIISVTLGKGYSRAHVILPWVSLGMLFMGLTLFLNKSFELREKTASILYILTGAAIFNVLLNLALVPLLGNQGAAVATCLAYACSLVATVVFGRRLIAWDFPWKICFKTVSASIAVGVLMANLPSFQSQWISIMYKLTVGFGLYSLIIASLEWRTFKSVFSAILGESFITRKYR